MLIYLAYYCHIMIVHYQNTYMLSQMLKNQESFGYSLDESGDVTAKPKKIIVSDDEPEDALESRS